MEGIDGIFFSFWLMVLLVRHGWACSYVLWIGDIMDAFDRYLFSLGLDLLAG